MAEKSANAELVRHLMGGGCQSDSKFLFQQKNLPSFNY